MSTFICMAVSIQGNCRYSQGELKKYKNKEFSVHKNRERKKTIRRQQTADIHTYTNKYIVRTACRQTLHRVVFGLLSADFFTLCEFIKYLCVFTSTVEDDEKNDGRWFSGRRRIGIIYREKRERNAAAATAAAGSISKARQPAPTFPLFSLRFFFQSLSTTHSPTKLTGETTAPKKVNRFSPTHHR